MRRTILCTANLSLFSKNAVPRRFSPSCNKTSHAIPIFKNTNYRQNFMLYNSNKKHFSADKTAVRKADAALKSAVRIRGRTAACPKLFSNIPQKSITRKPKLKAPKLKTKPAAKYVIANECEAICTKRQIASRLYSLRFFPRRFSVFLSQNTPS